MTGKDPIRLFVTHEFTDSEDYMRVFEYLESRDGFFYINCSNPEAGEGAGGLEAQQEELRTQIKQAEVVICPVGSTGLSALVTFELTVAQAFKIPVVAISSFGNTVVIPDKLAEAAAKTVDWNDRVIVDAIRQTARGEDTNTWDVIDFDPDEFS
ncbi:MAG: hypothetical protein QF790_05310 [Gammaproteobacteria bacterium]|jgi:hypothetical protein|nr:hypothetical protein [Gammaproteobacteria bacterium]MDP6616564.1 hypothetical protein [Gammaproteobacteria bacterium]MDP6694187.1 hypothetical protein [Gammaproteobacteria bacterium]